jgi:pimeloyl-ACP methyl ester carboxylesterase
MSSGRIVLVGYSVGGAIALHALARMIDEQPSIVLKRIAQLVLVQPAINGCPEVIKLVDEENPLPSIPPIVADVGEKDAPFVSRAKATIMALADLGIPVHIVYTRGDQVAPYETEKDERILEYRVSLPKSDAARRHLRLRSHPRTERFVYLCARPFVRWTPMMAQTAPAT